MKVLAVINPRARAVAAYGGRDWRARIEGAFAAADVEATVVDISQVPPSRALEAARASGAGAVVAGGGDGTVSSVASGLVGGALPLGVLALGTLNHFARDLGIPPALDDAVRTVAAGHTREVDVGEVNGRAFLNNSSIGLYPRIVRKRRTIMERLGHGKWVAAFYAAASSLRRSPLFDCLLVIDGRVVARRTPFVFVGNNRYEFDLLRLGTRERLDGGELSVYLPVPTGRFAMLRLALRGVLGLLAQGRDFESFSVAQLTVGTRRRRVHMGVDGELAYMRPPLRYRARPGALRVLVPPGD
jgi:diacylglycerol kinase family enzyme